MHLLHRKLAAGMRASASASAVLLNETFADGVFDDWTVTDAPGAQFPSNWYVSNGWLIQSENTNLGGNFDTITLPKEGTYAAYDGGYGWSDYHITLTMMSSDDDMIGVMFRVQDNNNYYRFYWDHQRQFSTLAKKVGGVWTRIFGHERYYQRSQNYQIDILAQGNLIQISTDGNLLSSVTDNSLAQGTIAMYCYANKGSYFRDILVTEP